jgi:2-amino-4-hydroxy-6-hydroxymethyldihydropteridine diphosphokinase
MGIAILGFGANLGAPEQKFEQVVARLRAHPRISSVLPSHLIRTSPIGGPLDQPQFLNGGIRVDTDLSPIPLLELLRAIEKEQGRLQADYWGPREIDLDMLLYDQQQLTSSTLTLPHPRFHYRRFALAPAAEIGGEALHPVFNLHISELLHRLDRLPRMVAIAGANAAPFARLLAERTGVALWDERVLSHSAAASRECITIWDPTTSHQPPPQLVIFLTELTLNPVIPLALECSLKATSFSTWITLNGNHAEASLVEAAAAIAAMRPFGPE